MVGAFSLALALILAGLLLYQPDTFAAAAALPPSGGPLMPPDFTPVASAPVAFHSPTPLPDAPMLAGSGGAPAALEPTVAQPSATATATVLTSTPIAVAPDVPPTVTRTPTATPYPIDAVLGRGAARSELAGERWISILLMGTDARPEEGLSRTDSMMVAALDVEGGRVVLISIPRDLWVWVPGYGQSRINTAYFMGQLYGNGAEVARQTVSNVLGIPIGHTITLDFGGFERLVDEIGGIDIDVPVAIDDPLYPDNNYGYLHLVIPAGMQHMDGTLALQYARTRHGDSDFDRARRQQAVLEAVREKVLQPEQIPNLSKYLLRAASEVETSLSLADLFYLARFARTLDRSRIAMHVIEAPFLWNGVTADGQQVLLYDPYTLQQAVQQWLGEDALSDEP